ncbi:hypothetical protein MKEN_01345300 [Mycena kentingensis (nom. inval.)]|nr:hypothetical protein MKEN_01345300 [Mycena kentingensis (nom. inval.)]
MLDSALVSEMDDSYAIKTARSLFRGRKLTTVSSSNGLSGSIDWRNFNITVDNVTRKWSSTPAEASWGDEFAFSLKYRNARTELVATRKPSPVAAKLNELHDERECMFLLLALLRMEAMRADQVARSEGGQANYRTAITSMGGTPGGELQIAGAPVHVVSVQGGLPD